MGFRAGLAPFDRPRSPEPFGRRLLWSQRRQDEARARAELAPHTGNVRVYDPWLEQLGIRTPRRNDG